MNDKIRNFSIIAHIDHGKSTLADRILEMTGSLTKRDIRAQTLDSMDIERERGITIKLNAVHLKYKDYILQLIDTPGHVDFTYEVSRSLAACEGAILVIDSTQGVEAQTISNVYLALENDLEIIPVINKIDLPNSDVKKVKKQVEDIIGVDCSDAPLISAKTGLNVEKVLEAVIAKVPSPKFSKPNAPLKALIFDSYFDEYRGVVLFVRIKQGKVSVGDKIKLFSTGAAYTVADLGINTPKSEKLKELKNGWVGWIACSIKNIKDVHVGDTLYRVDQPITHPLPGYKKKTSMVYAGLFPIDNNKYEDLKVALEKMALSDSSLIYEMETSQALGHGFRCGFLGLLHMDVIRERIEREYNIDLIATAPSVKFKINLTSKEQIEIISPADLPDKTKIISIEEPYVKMKTMLPEQYIGAVMDLCHKKRGIYKDLIHIDSTMRELVYEMPLGEIIWNFFDSIKSVSKGYATLDYEPIGYRISKLVKMDILVAGKAIDALSSIIHADNAYYLGRELTKLLKNEIPRHQFEVALQAAIGNKVIARETVKSYRKDVIAKCYGGDITRKKKLLSKQKAGKKRMKTVGAVEIPQSAFISVLKISN